MDKKTIKGIKYFGVAVCFTGLALGISADNAFANNLKSNNNHQYYAESFINKGLFPNKPVFNTSAEENIKFAINREQKEIEDLSRDIDGYKNSIYNFSDDLKNAKDETDARLNKNNINDLENKINEAKKLIEIKQKNIANLKENQNILINSSMFNPNKVKNIRYAYGEIQNKITSCEALSKDRQNTVHKFMLSYDLTVDNKKELKETNNEGIALLKREEAGLKLFQKLLLESDTYKEYKEDIILQEMQKNRLDKLPLLLDKFLPKDQGAQSEITAKLYFQDIDYLKLKKKMLEFDKNRVHKIIEEKNEDIER